jgi:hypothetical protein
MNLATILAAIVNFGAGYRTYTASAIALLNGLVAMLTALQHVSDVGLSAALPEINMAILNLVAALGLFGVKQAIVNSSATKQV